MADESNELESLRSEVATLRRTNSELVAKNATRKARITELESSATELQSKLDAASAEIREVRIGAPLTAMAESISKHPAKWMEHFARVYRLEQVNGELSILSVSDGKPVTMNGKAVPFEREALVSLLTDESNPEAPIFRGITILSRATGAAGHVHATQQPSTTARLSPRQFGLR